MENLKIEKGKTYTYEEINDVKWNSHFTYNGR